MALFRINTQLQFKVCNHDESCASPTTAREGELFYGGGGGEGNWEGYHEQRVHAFSLAELLPGRRGVFLLPLGLCYHCRAWERPFRPRTLFNWGFCILIFYKRNAQDFLSYCPQISCGSCCFCWVHQEPSPQESPEGTICIVTLPTIWIENWEVICLRLLSFFTLYCFPERCHLCFAIWTISTNDFQCKSPDKSSPLSYRPVHSRSRIIYTCFLFLSSCQQKVSERQVKNISFPYH